MRTNIFKLIAFVVAMMGITTACAAGNGTPSNTTATSYVEHLNSQKFMTKVADYTKLPFKYKGDKPCIIDFYATWCGPCRMISPYLDELSVKYKDQIYIYKIDIDQNRELATAFGASSIPLLIFVPVQGEPTGHRGALPKDNIEEVIKTFLLKK